MDVFDKYSIYYDLLYQDKDYHSESDYVYRLIKRFCSNAKSILELGCGTGRHAHILNSKGFDVEAIDISKGMVERAVVNFSGEGLLFKYGDVRSYRSLRKFDVIVSLFHVFSYQTEDDDVLNFFETVKHHLIPGGVLIYDFWYGPAVLSQVPEKRNKSMDNESYYVSRNADPIHFSDRNVVDVNYTVTVNDKKRKEKGH